MKESNILFTSAIIMGLVVFFVPLIDWLYHPEFTQMELFLEYRFLIVMGILFMVATIWLGNISEKKSWIKNIPPPCPDSFGAKGNIKELYEYLESRALTFDNVQECNDEQIFPLWVNIDEVYHLLKYYQDGTLKKFLDEQDSSGYWSFGYDACDFKMREFPDPRPEFPPNRS